MKKNRGGWKMEEGVVIHRFHRLAQILFWLGGREAKRWRSVMVVISMERERSYDDLSDRDDSSLRSGCE